MGWKNEKGEHMEWTTQNTKAVIEMVYDRMKKKQLQGPTFEIATWEDINNEFENITGQNFGVDRLKNKLDRLRHQHRDISKGGVWDFKYNKKGMICKTFKKRGLENDHVILGEIFNHSTKTRKLLGQASTQDPPSSDDKRAIEGAFLSKGVDIDPDAVDVDGDMQEFPKKRKTIGSSSDGQRKEAKNSRLEKLEATLSQWAESMNVKTKASNTKAYRYKAQANQATSSVTDPYSIEACMELLNSMEDIPSKMYNNALVRFKDKEWRLMFIKMPSCRRNDWLASLEH